MQRMNPTQPAMLLRLRLMAKRQGTRKSTVRHPMAQTRRTLSTTTVRIMMIQKRRITNTTMLAQTRRTLSTTVRHVMIQRRRITNTTKRMMMIPGLMRRSQRMQTRMEMMDMTTKRTTIPMKALTASRCCPACFCCHPSSGTTPSCSSQSTYFEFTAFLVPVHVLLFRLQLLCRL